MSLRFPLSIALLAAAASATWLLFRPAEPPAPDAVAAGAPVAAPARSASGASSPASSAPRMRDRRLTITPAPSAAAASSSLHGDYLRARSYKALYERLRETPEGKTPEGSYVLYQMLRQCANVPDRDWKTRNTRQAPQKREDFLAAIPENDPNRERRIAAFDEVSANRCAGMESVTVSNAELTRLLDEAAAAGDPKARALVLAQEVLQARRGNWREATLTDAQVSGLQQAFNSRDPEAMLVAGSVLSSSWHDFSLRIGAEGEVVEPRALMSAWQVLACDYGYPCGEESRRLLTACANQGHCDASNLPDFLFYYGATPHDYQLLSQYRSVLRSAVESGDWSQLRVVRGPTPQGSGRFFFMGPGR